MKIDFENNFLELYKQLAIQVGELKQTKHYELYIFEDIDYGLKIEYKQYSDEVDFIQISKNGKKIYDSARGLRRMIDRVNDHYASIKDYTLKKTFYNLLKDNFMLEDILKKQP